MVRKKQQLTQEEAIELLKKEPRGVLSLLGDDGYPYGVPLITGITRKMAGSISTAASRAIRWMPSAAATRLLSASMMKVTGCRETGL